MEDKRFAHIATDPKFRRIPKNERKVKIDKRFQSMFTDKKFKAVYSVDKRGRPVKQTSSEDLKRYYDVESGSSDSDEEDNSNEPGKFVKAPTNELNTKIKTDKNIPEEIKKKLANLKVDYARGESTLFSDSSSDDEDESEEELSEGEQIEHKWGELDNDAESTEEVTSRLAACNMDWDRIRAIDIMVLLNSFVPAGGAVKSVVIYPSEFGKKRMQEEETKGPIELVETKDEGEDNEEGSKYHMEKLRQYQLNRLKYYYAVITCDSPSTANKIYTECDGMEYESSATKIDLRFIPDEMSFDDEPKESCDKLPELNKYQPRFFTTTALQQAKVDLTWDETDPNRIEMTQKLTSGKIDEIDKNDLQNYLAVSSSEAEDGSEEEKSEDEEDSGGNPIDKYKLLLQEIEQKENEKKKKEVEMEVSWGIDLKEKTEKLVKKKMEEKEEKTPFERYLDKRKEKRKEKRSKAKKNDDDSDVPSDIDMNDPYFADEFKSGEFKSKNKKIANESSDNDETERNNDELELLLMNEDEESKKHFSLKKIQDLENTTSKKKRKNKGEEQKSDDFQVDVNDDRFSALFTSHLYNIDPTDPHYKKTKAMDTLISEKLKRRKEESDEQPQTTPGEKKMKKDAELSVLVKSVKRKAQALHKKSK